MQSHSTLTAATLHLTWLSSTPAAEAITATIADFLDSSNWDTSPSATKLIVTVSAGSGPADGPADGVADGAADGPADGISDGAADGIADGATDGMTDGAADGAADGPADGIADGAADGAADGLDCTTIPERRGEEAQKSKQAER